MLALSNLFAFRTLKIIRYWLWLILKCSFCSTIKGWYFILLEYTEIKGGLFSLFDLLLLLIRSYWKVDLLSLETVK